MKNKHRNSLDNLGGRRRTRQQHATELARLLTMGPADGWGDFKAADGHSPRLWVQTWVLPLVLGLVPELADAVVPPVLERACPKCYRAPAGRPCADHLLPADCPECQNRAAFAHVDPEAARCDAHQDPDRPYPPMDRSHQDALQMDRKRAQGLCMAHNCWSCSMEHPRPGWDGLTLCWAHRQVRLEDARRGSR